MMKPLTQYISIGLLSLLLVGVGSTSDAATIDLTPVYLSSYTDDITGDNYTDGIGWYVDAGADVYSNDLYERPTSETYTNNVGTYYASEYLGYLDLISAQYGYNDTYMFFQLTMYSPNLYKTDGVDTGVFGSGTYYGVQLGWNDANDGQLLLRAEQDKSTVDIDVSNGVYPLFDSLKTQGFYDTNNSVSGPGGVSTPDEEDSIPDFNGYETQQIETDGKLSDGSPVLYSRSFYNAGGTVSVELAFNYALYNLLYDDIVPSSLPYLVFETTRGLQDNQNYLWNDKYSFSEAGNPYNTSLGNIYELDNMRVGYSYTPPDVPIPEPSTFILLGSGLVGLFYVGRRRSRK